ncbi:hypothetical protein HKBW3S25_00513 [Candidatus Hakubella thermalkaliphila]|uniref:Uncharacterized protein n=1 Tax=Candidatus Hakubella thermalkaliphila TaxID=2754717 RepID=A0A6V8NYH1_9ACTN|nr:hypothetical protein HKBW3S25_00513 [Candidatus Hakubella thermalkaliphila]
MRRKTYTELYNVFANIFPTILERELDLVFLQQTPLDFQYKAGAWANNFPQEKAKEVARLALGDYVALSLLISERTFCTKPISYTSVG